ncbi:MAG TPA: BON domain-containing protein [Polyangiaceae bacterium]|nr:BON domain-containing protein [Polyangiaceae bacterium]
MNNKFGTGRRYVEQREPFWRGTAGDPALLSPDQEFETSGNYRQPGEPDTGQTRGGFSGRGPKGYARSDERIREDVCERLSWNDEIDATDIGVRVENGEVTLEGTAPTRYMKRLAADLAERVPGVSDVHNTVRVRKGRLTELKEKLTGDTDPAHYAQTGTRTEPLASPHGAS